MPHSRSFPHFLLLALVCELFSFPLRAQSDAPMDAQWLRLLHYRSSWTLPHLSSINTPEFFFDPLGPSDPIGERQASLEAMQKKTIVQRGKEVDPQCAFPARALYFRRLGLLKAEVHICPEFADFSSRLKLESISIVFSTAFAGNSASMFGHTILKLNRSDSASSRGLLDYGVAFLALSNPLDGPLYAVKGMFGGYPGFYNVQPYYELVNQYAYNENRDLWEYRIELNPEERAMLVAHLWEVNHGASASYYFTHVNCAAMLAELIDVVKPDWNIRGSMHGFVMPSELMRKVTMKVSQDKDRESAITFRASQRRLWLAKMERLSPEQLRIEKAAWAAQSLDGLTPDAATLDALLDQVTLKKGSVSFEEQKAVRAFEKDVLRARAEFPALPEIAASASNNPMDAHAPRRIGLSAGGVDGHARYGFRLKSGWHDLLDNPLGFEPYYHLNFIDLEMHQVVSEPKLSDLTLTIAEVWSLNPWRADDHQLSWIMGGGLAYTGEERSLFFRAHYGISGGNERFLVSLLPGAELRDNFEAGRVEVKAALRMQALARWTNRLRSLAILEISRDTYADDFVNVSIETRWDATQNYQVLGKWDRREELSKDARWELGLAHTF